MANNSAAYAYFVGFRFFDLAMTERWEAQEAIGLGYLTIEHKTGIIRFK